MLSAALATVSPSILLEDRAFFFKSKSFQTAVAIVTKRKNLRVSIQAILLVPCYWREKGKIEVWAKEQRYLQVLDAPMTPMQVS